MQSDYARRLDEDISVVEADISNQMGRLPSIYSYWANQLSEAEKILRDKKTAYSVWVSERRNEIMVNASKENKKLTVQDKEDALILNYRKDYDKWENDVSEWTLKVDQLKNGVDALQMKSRMVSNIAQLYRTEREVTAASSLRQRS